MSNSEQITLKKQILNVDSPNYYVTVNEGAFFDLCKSKDKNLTVVSTSGLNGCVAIAIYIKFGDRSYIFLNHIISDLPISKVNSQIDKVKNTIKKYVQDFDYNDDLYEISVFVVGNQFKDLRRTTQQERRNTQDIAYEIVENLSKRMKSVNRVCYYAYATSVGFSIEGNKVRLIEPDWKNTKGKLTYYGTRHGGYGPSLDPNDDPYKNTCIETELEI
jgi:hypothetical protein